jgi:hypothetical protein
MGTALVALAAISFVAFHANRACAQAEKVRIPSCSNAGAANNTELHSNNCRFELRGTPNGLSQSGIQIGTVESAIVNPDGISLSIENPRIFSATTDFSVPFEFRGQLINCPIFAGIPNRQTAELTVVFFGRMSCEIVRAWS